MVAVEDLSVNDAQQLLGLCLAQSGEPHKELGYSSWGDAYQKIGALLGVHPAKVTFSRNNFDRYTDSLRKGWDKPISYEMQCGFDAVQGLDRGGIIALGRKILARDWSAARSTEMSGRLEDKLVTGFGIDGFTPLVEPMDTVWGIRNKPGRTFRLSNSDLVIAFEEILANWPEWVARNLNKNSVNPDTTLTEFAGQYFSEGAHQVLANDQRRGFLHLISAIAYLCSNNGPFDQQASSQTLPKEYYELALEVLSGIQAEAVKGFSRALNLDKTGESDQQQAEAKPADVGENKIYYGAPGTGKSHRVNELVGQANVVRTVFHPDTQNSDFFGCLKPRMDGEKVTYQFAPGPFSTALAGALCDPAHHHYLVIEELNRAPAAAVFGELFQLLDRADTGAGNYEVDFPNPESKAWFAGKGIAAHKLRMPSNLTIIATMNSADQGVYPLDTAFRRRWEQVYLPLTGDNAPNGLVHITGAGGASYKLDWRHFVGALNDWLLKRDIAEDRLLGLWFVKERELNGPVPAKILLYLWDDLLRHEGRDHVFALSIKTYGQLDAAVTKALPVFSAGFIGELSALVPGDPVAPAEEEVAQAEGEADAAGE